MTYLIAIFNALLFVAGAIVVADFGGLEYLFLGMVLAFGATGAVIARRQPRNPLGWMFLVMSFGAALAEMSSAIADRWGTPLAATYASASWILPMVPALTFLMLLFPDGRPLSPRWRPAVWAAGIGLVSVLIGTLTKPGPLEDYPEIDNPIGWSGSDPFDGLGSLLVFCAIVSGIVSLILRFRRAEQLERQQVKWLALAGVFGGGGFILGFALFALLPEGEGETVIYTLMMTGVLALPVAAAVAMLRYRLYDIDVVVNRALVYAALTATLAVTYLATVLLLQLVLPERSDFAVAASTLAVAAAFGPARRRIQSAVDRRFFRRHYDAAQTLLGFGARLRDEVDLTAVSAELTQVTTETMQPAHVSLWLRGT
jgi:hypothetical protein